MIIDADLMFAAAAGESLSITAESTKDVVLSKTIDLGEPGNAVGGNELALYVMSTVAGTVTGTVGVQFKLQTSADNSNWSDVVLSPVMPAAFKAGVQLFRVKMVDGFKRYLRVVAVTSSSASTDTMTAGKVTAFLTREQ